MLISSVLVALPISAEGEDIVEYSDEWEAVSDLADLKGMQSNGFYYLTENITLDSTWTPLEIEEVTISGKDTTGAVHTITFAGGAYSLLRSCNNYTVSDLNLAGTITMNGTEGIGVVSPLTCETSYPTAAGGGISVTNVTSSVVMTINGLTENNSASATYNGDAKLAKSVGGVAGYIEPWENSTVTFENVWFTGSIAVNCRAKYVGGIAAGVMASRGNGSRITFEDCVKNGSITYKSRYEIEGTRDNGSKYDIYSSIEAIGGITGVLAGNYVTVDNCTNNAAITAQDLSGDGLGPIDKANSPSKVIKTVVSYLGGLLGNVWGAELNVTNCTNTKNGTLNNISSGETPGGVGGLIGRFANIDNGLVDNCVNHAALTSGRISNAFGGVIGRLGNSFIDIHISNCVNYGNIRQDTMASNMGGIVGAAGSDALDSKRDGVTLRGETDFTIENCVNEGTLTYNVFEEGQTNRGFGGILGSIECIGDNEDTISQNVDSNGKAIASKHYIINCHNKATGDILTPNTTGCVVAIHAGGIVGKVIATPHIDIRHCVNEGDILIQDPDNSYGWSEAGGILGGLVTYCNDTGPATGTNWYWSRVTGGDIYIYDCHNFGKMFDYNVGGIFGATVQIYEEDVNVYINGCTNSGEIVASTVVSNGYAGGIVGKFDESNRSYGNLYVDNCVNYGAVTGTGAAGIVACRQSVWGEYSDGTKKADGSYNTFNQTYYPQITQITNCSNVGTIKATGEGFIAAGIISNAHSKNLTINNCSNTGTIVNDTANPCKVEIALHMNYTNDQSVKDAGADGYTTVTATGNYRKTDGTLSSSYTKELGDKNESSANTLYNTNFKKAYSKGAVINGGVASELTTHTNYIYNEHHLTSATQDGAALTLKLYNDITVENTAANLTRPLNNSTFDGNGKTVTFQNGGLFLFNLIQNSEIRNLNLAGNISSSGSGYLAPLSAQGSSYGLVLEDITSSVNITVTPSGNLEVGGVIGKIITSDGSGSGTATINNVTYSGTIKSFADVATGASGGVVGNIGCISPTLQGDVTVTDCSSSGTVTSKGISDNDHSAAGGLFGSIEKNVTVSECEFTGTISIEDERVCAGGIAGHIYAKTPNDVISVSKCDNYGKITSGNAAGIVGGVCADFPEEAITSSTADLSCLNQYNTVKITVDDCQNAGGATIKGYRNAAGILGDVTMIYSQRLNDTAANSGYLQPELTVSNCVNSAAIEVYDRNRAPNIYVAGIVACANRGIVTDCINEGDLYGVMRTAGIVGAKHKPTTEMLTIKNCKNTGDVKGRLFSAGIISMCWQGNLEILNCVNAGDVDSFGFDNADTQIFAGGILAYVGLSVPDNEEDWLDKASNDGLTVVIDSCVNAGAVDISGATGGDLCRLGDGWKSAGGVVGGIRGDLTVSNCVNLGAITSGSEQPNYSSYPIVNGNEICAANTITLYNHPERLVTASGNYYLEGSVLQPTDGGSKSFQFSEQGDAATLEATVRAADVYVFDKSMIDANDGETIAGIAKDIIANNYDGMYTTEQRAELDAEYANATAVYGNLDPYLEQNSVYDAEDTLRDAVFSYTDEATYMVYIPVGNVAAEKEYTVEFRPTDFTRFSSAEVEIDSANDFKLIDSHGNTLDYVLKDSEDNVYGDGALLFERGNEKNASNKVISKTIKAVVTPDDTMPPGTYRDTLSYTVTYRSGKPNEGT